MLESTSKHAILRALRSGFLRMIIRTSGLTDRNNCNFFQIFPSYHSPVPTLKVRQKQSKHETNVSKHAIQAFLRNEMRHKITPYHSHHQSENRGKKFMYSDIIYVLPFQDFRIKKTFINVKKVIALVLWVFLSIPTMQ